MKAAEGRHNEIAAAPALVIDESAAVVVAAAVGRAAGLGESATVEAGAAGRMSADSRHGKFGSARHHAAAAAAVAGPQGWQTRQQMHLVHPTGAG